MLLMVQQTDSATIQRFISRARPPNTVGNSVASKASGPINRNVGATPNTGPLVARNPCVGFSSLGFSYCSASGPKPGSAFSFGAGNGLPSSPSCTAFFNSSVVPLNVRRRYGSP